MHLGQSVMFRRDICLYLQGRCGREERNEQKQAAKTVLSVEYKMNFHTYLRLGVTYVELIIVKRWKWLVGWNLKFHSSHKENIIDWRCREMFHYDLKVMLLVLRLWFLPEYSELTLQSWRRRQYAPSKKAVNFCQTESQSRGLFLK